MSRKTKGRSNYKPLSSSFCKSVLKEPIVKNTEGTASIRKRPDKFVITCGKQNEPIFRTDPIRYQIVEILRYGFDKDVLTSYCEFTEEEIFEIIPDIYSSFEDFLFVLGNIPDVGPDEILYRLKTLKSQIEKSSKTQICKKYGVTSDGYKNLLNLLGIQKISIQEKVDIEEEQVIEEQQNDTLLKKVKREVEMSEYESLLGFSNCVINYDCLIDEYKKGNFYCYEMISSERQKNELIYYIFKNKFGCFTYSRPFYPAEDKILEKFYHLIGIRVIDVMRSVIPNYESREDWEYLNRIRECKYKTPHPQNGFELFKEDFFLIQELYNTVKKSPTKYFFWLDNFDLQYYAKKMGFSVKESKKQKIIIDLESIDLRSYIHQAEKFKEVIYHHPFWSSDKHSLFKKLYSQKGLSVIDDIPNLTIDMCREHSSQYRIYQSYTDNEVNRMKEVYLSEGLTGLVKKFPYRSYDGLKYKIEDEGWDKLLHEENQNEKQSAKIEFLVQEQLSSEREKLKSDLKSEILQDLQRDIENHSSNALLEELKKSVLEDEMNRIRKRVRSDEAAKIEEEARTRMKKTVEKEVERDFKQNVYPKLREEVLLEAKRDIISNIEALDGDVLRENLFVILDDMSLVDIYKELPKSIKLSFIKLLKSTVLS